MGRNSIYLEEPNCLQLRWTVDRNDQQVSQLVHDILDLGILSMDHPYTLGYDCACDVVSRGHYHLSGYTRLVQSRIKTLRMTKMDSYAKYGKDLVITSKTPVLADDGANKHLRYAIKENLVKTHMVDSNWIEIHSVIAEKEYKYKLEGKRKALAKKIDNLDLYVFIEKWLKDNDISIVEYGHVNFPALHKIIIQYAISHKKEFLLNEKTIRQRALYYLGSKGLCSIDELYEIIF